MFRKCQLSDRHKGDSRRNQEVGGEIKNNHSNYSIIRAKVFLGGKNRWKKEKAGRNHLIVLDSISLSKAREGS